jgi:hypothetical protein
MIKNLLKEKKQILNLFQKNSYVQQRKVNWKKFTEKHPWKELEKYKESTKNIPRIEDVPENVPIYIHDKILEKNIEDMEKLKSKGLIPGYNLVKEDPGSKKK